MGRYLVDVTCTFLVECDSPDDFEEALDDVLGSLPIDPLDIRGWRLDDSFTVLEP